LRVRAAFGDRVTALTLFGSRARGEGRDDSDLDLLVLVDRLQRFDRRLVQDIVCDVGLAHRLVLSPVVVDAMTWWSTTSPLARVIAKDGWSL